MADNNADGGPRTDGEEEHRQERDPEEVRDRADEAESVTDDPGERLGDLDEALETHDYPTTTNELIEACGDYQVETRGGSKSLREVFASTGNEAYESADDVRNRIQGLINR